MLRQNNEETTGQKSEFPQAGGLHDSSDDRWTFLFQSSLLFKGENEFIGKGIAIEMASFLSTFMFELELMCMPLPPLP